MSSALRIENNTQEGLVAVVDCCRWKTGSLTDGSINMSACSFDEQCATEVKVDLLEVTLSVGSGSHFGVRFFLRVLGERSPGTRIKRKPYGRFSPRSHRTWKLGALIIRERKATPGTLPGLMPTLIVTAH